MNATQQGQAARQFAKSWRGRGSEKSDTQTFWMALLRDVLGVDRPEETILFEREVGNRDADGRKHTMYIDGSIPGTHTLIEQKSADVALDAPSRQSDGSLLTPFQQAKRYGDSLPYEDRPRWIVTCNFAEFRIHDMNQPLDPPEIIRLEDLERDWRRLRFLVDVGDAHMRRDTEASLRAGDIVGRLHDALLRLYRHPDSAESLHSLNVLCVRLVFLLYAEDSGILGAKDDIFRRYLTAHRTDARHALMRLFEVLDVPEDRRDGYDMYLEEDLAAFPYVNGGLFREAVEIPTMLPEIVDLILARPSDGFGWSEISPTVFGSIFESTLNPDTRREGGMHYTTPKNIHRVIDPLFLDGLRAELDRAASFKQAKTRQKHLAEFRRKLAGLKFLDPACGSGNFLTETFLSLRRLENEAVRIMAHDHIGWEAANPIGVSISQFHGIEVNDFACAVAQTALWIAEAQMLQETETILSMEIEYLPLTTAARIVEGNALRMDWNDVLPVSEASYVMGNPPFSGARVMGTSQKGDVQAVFEGWRNVGNLDYVACWFKKAADYIGNTGARVAFVATNSISQGESVANLWGPLFAEGVHIDFAWRTFRWDSEAMARAQVHVVIVGFGRGAVPLERIIHTVRVDGGGTRETVGIINASNINGYLMDGPNICVESRRHPLCEVPPMGIGNKPIDGGHYLFTEAEMEEFVNAESASGELFRPWYGAEEFINRKPRWCLWLGDCTPDELSRLPECMKRVRAVREHRLASRSEGTRRIAASPTRFHVENMPAGSYIVVPEVSSERRRYIPIGYMDDGALCSNKLKIVRDGTLYHFGVLISAVHMAWMRAVSGRLKSDYSYSVNVVYNNYPWPDLTREQRARIERTAQGILDARALYPNSTLAALYDEATMPPELRKAHRANDRAVADAYGVNYTSPVTDNEWNVQDAACVAKLMDMYAKLSGRS